MAFYLRKSFRMGPVRLNLSKSGLGVSAGVRGARVGVNARGQSYVHAGRGGLYFRQNLTSQARRNSGGDPLTLYENTGVGYSSGQSSPRPELAIPDVALRPAHRGAWAMVVGVLFLAIEPVIGLIAIAGGLFYLVLAGNKNNARRQLQAMLNRYVIGEGGQATILAADAHIKDKAIEREVAKAEFCRAYLTLCRQIVEDGVVSDSELEALNTLGEQIGHESQFARAARSDAFRVMHLAAVADHDVDEEEESTLRHIRERLDVPDDEIVEELAFIEELKRLRSIRSGEVETIQTTHKLQKGEQCYFQAEGRFLKEKQLRSYTQDGQRYKIRGLVDDKQGTLLITNKRVLLIHSGTSSVRHDKIFDVDLDIDENVIRVTKDGSSAPTIITTPRALEAAALIEGFSAGTIKP